MKIILKNCALPLPLAVVWARVRGEAMAEEDTSAKAKTVTGNTKGKRCFCP